MTPIEALTDIVERADESFVAYMRAMTERAGGVCSDLAGLFTWMGASTSPYIVNGAIPVGPLGDPSGSARAVAGRFGEAGHSFGMHVRAHADGSLESALVEFGWPVAVDLTVMSCSVPLPAAPSATLRWVRDEAGVAEFRSVCEDAFGPAVAAAARSAFSRPESILAGDTAAVLAESGGQVAAAALVFVGIPAACVAWVGTRPAFRNQGLGELVTRAVTNRAFELGAGVVTLQASPQGESVYRAIGFAEISRYRVYEGPRA